MLKTAYFKRHDAMMWVICCYFLQELEFVEEQDAQWGIEPVGHLGKDSNHNNRSK